MSSRRFSRFSRRMLCEPSLTVTSVMKIFSLCCNLTRPETAVAERFGVKVIWVGRLDKHLRRTHWDETCRRAAAVTAHQSTASHHTHVCLLYKVLSKAAVLPLLDFLQPLYLLCVTEKPRLRVSDECGIVILVSGLLENRVVRFTTPEAPHVRCSAFE